MNHNQLSFRTAIVITLLLAGLFSAAAQGVQPKQEQLLNGLKVVMLTDPTAPTVAAKLRIHAGAAFDPQQKEGTMCLLSEAFFPNQDSRDFFTDDLGGSFKVVCNYDYIEIDATSRSEAYLTMLETIASSVTNPVLDRQTTDAVKAQQVTKLEAVEKMAGFTANLAVRKRLLGTFPYGRPVNGSAAGLKGIDFADLKFAYERLFGADNATLVLSGNFPADMAYRGIRRYFGSWQKADRKVPSTFQAAEVPPTGTQIIESPEAGLTEVRYALRGVARNAKDFAAADVFARVIEQRLRVKAPDGQRENVWVKSHANVLPGVIIVGFSKIQREITAAVTGDRSKADGNDLIANAIGEKLTDAEVAAAYNAAKADFSKVDIATRWLDIDTYKLTSVKADQAAFDSVTLADVQRLADKLKLQPVASVLVLSQKSGN